MTFRFFSILVFLVTAGCAACSQGGLVEQPTEYRMVKDGLGRDVRVPATITRIVSLAPDLTENVFAVGAGGRLVGVTTFCTFPAEARGIAKIGDTMNPNMEAIVGLRPDIVLVSTASQIEAFMRTLGDKQIAVYVSNPDSLDAVLSNLTRFGDLFGTPDAAGSIVSDLTKRIAALESGRENTAATRVFVQISREPLFTIGKGSFLTGALEKINAVSVTADVETAYPKLSKETAATLEPDVIVLSDSDDNREPNAVFTRSRAYTTGRVVRIDADLISRPGPRLVDALERLKASFEDK